MRFWLPLLLLVVPAQAKDVMLILTEQDKIALVQLLDMATHDRGLAVARNTLYFVDRINNAPEVVKQEDHPDEKKDSKP